MKKKVGMTLAALLAAAVVLSVTAHRAEPPQAVIGSGDGGTAISITDITPREGENKEDSENDTKNYTVSSHYPVSVQTAEEGGVQLLVKTFLVPEDTAPTELIEKDLTVGVSPMRSPTSSARSSQEKLRRKLSPRP